MTRLALAACAAMLVGGCATQPAADSAGAAEPVRFLCERGTSVAVRFLGDRALIEAPAGSRELRAEPTGSGFLYGAEGESLRGKDHELTWTRADGSVTACREESWAMGQPQVEPPPLVLSGSRWTLVRFESSDDAIGTVVPPNPERYTLAFEVDGGLALQLDCNRASGRWQATPSSADSGALVLTGGAMTRAMCQPGALDTQIARDLGRIRSYLFRGGRLYLSLEADGGTYEFKGA